MTNSQEAAPPCNFAPFLKLAAAPGAWIWAHQLGRAGPKYRPSHPRGADNSRQIDKWVGAEARYLEGSFEP